MPTSSGSTRHTVGGGGVVLRATPSGVVCTLRNDASDAAAAANGTATSIPA
jgi:hypothetical protein